MTPKIIILAAALSGVAIAVVTKLLNLDSVPAGSVGGAVGGVIGVLVAFHMKSKQ